MTSDTMFFAFWVWLASAGLNAVMVILGRWDISGFYASLTIAFVWLVGGTIMKKLEVMK